MGEVKDLDLVGILQPLTDAQRSLAEAHKELSTNVSEQMERFNEALYGQPDGAERKPGIVDKVNDLKTRADEWDAQEVIDKKEAALDKRRTNLKWIAVSICVSLSALESLGVPTKGLWLFFIGHWQTFVSYSSVAMYMKISSIIP